MKRLNKKGFSIVEVIVAMVIISIVSVSALSIVAASADNTRAAMYKAEAQYFVYDALECFKSSTSEDEFIDSLIFRGNITEPTLFPEGEIPGAPEGENANIKMYAFAMKDSNYAVLVYVSFGDNNHLQNGLPTDYKYDSFSIYVFAPNNNQPIASIYNYQKRSQ